MTPRPGVSKDAPVKGEPVVSQDAPITAEDLYRCVHCGLCLSACPTYMETGLETESPRGRIALMKAVHEGRLDINRRVAGHWDMCLACRACETACPSGVPYGRLIETARRDAVEQGAVSWRHRMVAALFLRGLLPRLRMLRLLASALRLYQRRGLRRLVRWSRILKLLPGGLDRLEAQLPELPTRFFAPQPGVLRAVGETRMKVGLLSGCVMPVAQAPTMDAAARILRRNGCDVATPVGQGCCGALNLHSGDPKTARGMARRNIDAFLDAGVDRIVTASAGCGSAMKEYGELLEDDPVYAERAARAAAMTVDITEFLAGLPLDPPRGRVDARATYQDPCHLAHAQRITEAPRTLLRGTPGLELVEMEEASRCCGAAGIYTITQRRMSERLLASKMEWVLAAGVDMVVTANPGCAIQLENGLREAGSPVRVCHVVDVLDQAYQAEEGPSPSAVQ